ncbi:MAG: hypothetical protein ABJE95_38250 [Byssovorax sp.]
MTRASRKAALFFAPLLLVACGKTTADPAPLPPPPSASVAVLPAPVAPPRQHRPPATRTGSALVRTPAGDALLLADEDHQVLRRIPLPVDVNTPPLNLPVPGGPAQVVALDDSVLVTVRDPGLLIVYRQAGAGLVETGRVDLPADAWGLAVTADEKTALISSAWTHRITAVDLTTLKQRWSVPVAREPRGVAITAAGVAYVSHLVGPDLTRIDTLAGEHPEVHAVTLPAAPLRAAYGLTLDASLGYAAVLSPDDSRLFVPRHALGAQGRFWWFGEPTVDVLLTADDSPLAPKRARNTMTYHHPDDFAADSALQELDGPVPLSEGESFVQPRAAIYRASTDTLLITSEGLDTLTEVDALSLDPSLSPLRVYRIGNYPKDAKYPYPNVVESGGAPSAVALSVDQSTAYVFSRSTDDISIVTLDSFDAEKPAAAGPIPFVHLADDTLPDLAATGRRLFYTATDGTISGGLGCAGCHPDGRDDGHVWHENDGNNGSDALGYRSGPVTFPTHITRSGVPRQTPMLAGRVASHTTYGWNGKSASLEDRIRVGFAIHRWGGNLDASWMVAMDRPKSIAAFLRTGLVAPPRETAPLTPEEQRGKEVFADSKVGCAACHVPALEFTDRSIVALPRPQRRDFEAEKEAFKTPSLLFVGGTAPYFHDGSAATLEDVILKNNDAMGHTSHLGPADRTALIAYLRTL